MRYKKQILMVIFVGLGILSVSCGRKNEEEIQKMQETQEIETNLIQMELLGEINADLTHDGVEDKIIIRISNGSGNDVSEKDYHVLLGRGEFVSVEVYDGTAESGKEENAIQSFDFGTAHAGNGNLALVEMDGLMYLVRYSNAIFQGMGVFGYDVFYINPDGGIAEVESDEETYYMDIYIGDVPEMEGEALPDFYEYCNVERLLEIEGRLDEILGDAVILVSAQLDSQKCYVYSEKEEYKQSALDVFAAEAGDGSNEMSIEDYCANWRKQFEENWYSYKQNMSDVKMQ